MDGQQPQQPQQYQQQQKQPAQFIQPIFQDAHARNLVASILDPSKIIEQIEYNLRGFKQDNEGNWIPIKNVKPVKEDGITQITGLLREHLPQNQTLANLEENDILKMIKRVLKALCGLIHDDWEKFTYTDDDCDDPNIALHDRIYVCVRNNIFSNLTRAKGGAENKNLRTIYRLTDMANVLERTAEIQPRRSFFGNLFRPKVQQQQQQQQGGQPYG